MTEINLGPCACCGGDCNGYPQTARCLWSGNVSNISDLDTIKETDWRVDQTVTLPFVTSATASGTTTLKMAETNQSNWAAYITGESWATLQTNNYVTTHSPLRLKVTIMRCCSVRSTTYYYVSLTTGKINGTNFPPASFNPALDAIYIELQPFLCPEEPLTAVWTVSAGTELYQSAANCLPCTGTQDGVDITFAENVEAALPSGSLGECGYFGRYEAAGDFYSPFGGLSQSSGSLIPMTGENSSFYEYDPIHSGKICANSSGAFIPPDNFYTGNPDPLNNDSTLEDYIENFFGDFNKCTPSNNSMVYTGASCDCLDRVEFVRGDTSDPYWVNCPLCGYHQHVNVMLYLRIYPKANVNYSIDLDEIEQISGSRDVRGVAAISTLYPNLTIHLSNISCCKRGLDTNDPVVYPTYDANNAPNDPAVNHDGDSYRFVERLGQNLSGAIPSNGSLPSFGTGNWIKISLSFCPDKTSNWSNVVDNICNGSTQVRGSTDGEMIMTDFYIAVKK